MISIHDFRFPVEVIHDELAIKESATICFFHAVHLQISRYASKQHNVCEDMAACI